MLRTTALAGALGVCLATGVAFAQAEPDNAIKYRQTIYETLGANLTAVVMNLKGEVSFPDAVGVHARTVADTAPLVLPAMEQDTAGRGSAETEALDKIWDNWDDFTAKAEDMQAAAVRLAELAQGDDMQAIGAQVQELGGTCKSCHDEYRD
ncbi:MAG: cytochrome c [Alphaproteobacteria bacterium]|jgi:cytochrome c556|nr:cytochrome c [Alphaproteobacteria bacterium]